MCLLSPKVGGGISIVFHSIWDSMYNLVKYGQGEATWGELSFLFLKCDPVGCIVWLQFHYGKPLIWRRDV